MLIFIFLLLVAPVKRGQTARKSFPKLPSARLDETDVDIQSDVSSTCVKG